VEPSGRVQNLDRVDVFIQADSFDLSPVLRGDHGHSEVFGNVTGGIEKLGPEVTWASPGTYICESRAQAAALESDGVALEAAAFRRDQLSASRRIPFDTALSVGGSQASYERGDLPDFTGRQKRGRHFGFRKSVSNNAVERQICGGARQDRDGQVGPLAAVAVGSMTAPASAGIKFSALREIGFGGVRIAVHVRQIHLEQLE
jgi:hypothetical protein